MEIFINNIFSKKIKNLIKKQLFVIILIIHFQGIELITAYKSFYFQKFGKIFTIYDSCIHVYDSANLNNINSFFLTGELQIISSEESKMISASYFYNEEFQQIYILVKHHVFFYTKDKFNGNSNILNNHNGLSDIISYDCVYENSEPVCHFFVAIINEQQNMRIFKYQFNSKTKHISLMNDRIFELKNSNGNKSNSQCDNVSCQLMSYSSNTVLTCFYENENSELCSINIKVDNLDEDNLKEQKFIKNSGAVHIKSVLFNDNQKAFVCYINNKNNIACIIYEINGNQWLLEYKYIEKCNDNIHLFNIDYYYNKNQYILSCFTSETNIEYAIFKNQFDINDNSKGNYCLTSLDTDNCYSNLISSVIIYNLGSYYLKTFCSSQEPHQISNYDFSENCNKNYEKERIIIEENTNTEKKQEDKTTEATLPPSKESEATNHINEDKENKNELIKIKTNKTIEEFTNNLTNIIKDVNLEKNYEIKSDNFMIKINPIDYKDLNNNSTYINFQECEKTLRRNNRIPQSSKLYVVTLEIYKNDKRSLTNQVEYIILNENKERLSLSDCENDEIEINYRISNTSLIDKEKISYFSDLGIDILNSKDKFFNDICYPYADKSSDVILSDRIINIYQNFSMCDNNCQYSKIDLDLMIIKCKCHVKKSISSTIEKLTFDHILLDLISNSSIGVVKCYDLVFNFKTKLENMGFWILLIIFLIHMSFIIHYFIYGITPIKKFIVNEMKKYNYLNNFSNPQKKLKSDIYNISNNQTNQSTTKISIKKRKNKVLKGLKKFEKNNKKRKLDLKDSIKSANDSKNKEQNLITSFNKLGSSKYINLEIYNKNKIFNNNIIKKENEYFLIQINANNSINNLPPESNFYLNNYDFEEAVKYDKRTFWRIYYICLLAKENILNILLIKSPLELKSLRLSVFVFMYTCDLAFNTLFYFNSNISDRYYYEGNSLFWFSLFNNTAISLISSILSFLICIVLQFLTNSKENVEEVFRKEEKKMRENSEYTVNKIKKKEIIIQIYEINKQLKYKIILFIILESALLLFFFYFITAFCEVYQKTQVSWLCDSFVSFILSFPIEFLLAFIYALLYKLAITKKYKLLYNVVMTFYNLS